MKFNETLKNGMLAAIKCKNNVALIGEPGIGKSSFMENFAETVLCSKCFTLACNQLADKADLTGARLVPYTAPDGSQQYKSMFYPHQVIADAIDYAAAHPSETPVLFLDEINRSTTDVTSAALSLTTLRQIGSSKLPDNLIIVVAGNDKGNVTSLDSASISRFIKIYVEPDTDTYLGLDPTLNPFIKQVLQKKPDLIFCKSLDIASPAASGNDDDDDEGQVALAIEDIVSDGEGMHQITTPRTLTALSVWLNNMPSQELMKLMVQPAMVDGVQLTMLDEWLIGFIGYTNFEVELFNVIQAALNQGAGTTSNALVPSQPSCYKELKSKATTDVQQLNDYIDSLNDKQRSASLLYALYENDDNRRLVKALSDKTKFVREDMNLFVQCFTGGLFSKSVTGSESNLDAFLETGMGSQFASLMSL